MGALRTFYRGLRESEEALIGFERSPPGRVLAASSWAPDRVVRYCERCGATRPALALSCAQCLDRRLAWCRVVRLGAYREPLSNWVREIKYARWHGMGRQLGRELGRRVSTRCMIGGLMPDVVVPVPMPRVRRLVRGIDHARVVACGVAEEVGLPVRCPLIQTRGRTQASRTSSERERRASPFGRRGFAREVSGGTVLLIDDVLTSGRTAGDMARALRGLGANKVVFGVVAVTDPS